MTKLAIYTTMYPAGSVYWEPFLASLTSQTATEFTLWVGLDGVDAVQIEPLIRRFWSGRLELRTHVGGPTAVRLNTLRELCQSHEFVVLVDSDDICLPTRAEQALDAMGRCDLSGCGLRLIDRNGSELGKTFAPPPELAAADVLPVANCFGFSNTTYDSPTLERCLPESTRVTLLDWHVATRAWLMGARIEFDRTPRMLYRQYGENTASVSGELFTSARIASDAPRVSEHYDLLLAEVQHETAIPERLERVVDARRALLERTRLRRDGVCSSSFRCGDRVPLWWEWLLPQPLHTDKPTEDNNED